MSSTRDGDGGPPGDGGRREVEPRAEPAFVLPDSGVGEPLEELQAAFESRRETCQRLGDSTAELDAAYALARSALAEALKTPHERPIGHSAGTDGHSAGTDGHSAGTDGHSAGTDGHDDGANR